MHCSKQHDQILVAKASTLVPSHTGSIRTEISQLKSTRSADSDIQVYLASHGILST